MGMRINTNMASIDAQRNLKVSTAEQQSTFGQLSSGKRITKAADDAAGLAIATSLNAQNKGLVQASRSAQDGISMVQVAEGGLNESTNILTRLRELSIQASSDTLGDTERGYLQKEYGQLVEEVDRIATSSQFNGKHLLRGDGETGRVDIQVGAFGTKEDKISWDTSDTNATSAGLGIEGLAVLTKEDATDSLQVLDDAISKVSGYRSNLGALQSRLGSAVNNIDVQYLNQEAARSRIEDVDVASASAKLASANVKTAAGTAVLAQANGLSQNALRLVG
jgi:flagellin